MELMDREITSKSDDLTILYDLFKNQGKLIAIDDLKKDFYKVYQKEKDSPFDVNLVEARFWDSLTTLQYLGFLSLDNQDAKATRLDFALFPLSWKQTNEYDSLGLVQSRIKGL